MSHAHSCVLSLLLQMIIEIYCCKSTSWFLLNESTFPMSFQLSSTVHAEAEETVHHRLLKTHYLYRMWELEVPLKITKFKPTFDRQDNRGQERWSGAQERQRWVRPQVPEFQFSNGLAPFQLPLLPSSLSFHLALSPRRAFLLLHLLSFPLKLQIWNSVFSYALAFFHVLWGGWWPLNKLLLSRFKFPHFPLLKLDTNWPVRACPSKQP